MADKEPRLATKTSPSKRKRMFSTEALALLQEAYTKYGIFKAIPREERQKLVADCGAEKKQVQYWFGRMRKEAGTRAGPSPAPEPTHPVDSRSAAMNPEEALMHLRDLIGQSDTKNPFLSREPKPNLASKPKLNPSEKPSVSRKPVVLLFKIDREPSGAALLDWAKEKGPPPSLPKDTNKQLEYLRHLYNAELCLVGADIDNDFIVPVNAST
jgi:hypothetical protein